jgi:hypothetical protein
MSTQEMDVGTAYLIKEFKPNDDFFECLCKLFNNYTLSPSEFKDYLSDNDYIIVDNSLYKFRYDINETPETIFYTKLYDDGSIDFTLFYPNGGNCTRDMLEDAIRRAKNENL